MPNKQDMVRALTGVECKQPHGMTKEKWDKWLRYLYESFPSVAYSVDQIVNKKIMTTEEQWNTWLEILYLKHQIIKSEVDKALACHGPGVQKTVGERG
jgi:hypothetical protein